MILCRPGKFLKTKASLEFLEIQISEVLSRKSTSYKGAGASEAPGQTKEEFSANDTSRHPKVGVWKVLKIGPQHG